MRRKSLGVPKYILHTVDTNAQRLEMARNYIVIVAKVNRIYTVFTYCGMTDNHLNKSSCTVKNSMTSFML